MTYAGDGTPITIWHNVAMQSSGASVKRSDRGSSEYFVHHLIVVTVDALGKRQAFVILEDPRPMSSGKKAVKEVVFLLQILPDARSIGHRGIEISVWMFC